MSHGNLERKVVAFDFWPACENCRFFASCKGRPCHPAYPHTWHWGREFAAFADGYLIVRSWVGSWPQGLRLVGNRKGGVGRAVSADRPYPIRRSFTPSDQPSCQILQ